MAELEVEIGKITELYKLLSDKDLGTDPFTFRETYKIAGMRTAGRSGPGYVLLYFEDEETATWFSLRWL